MTSGWVRSWFRFLSCFLIVSLLSSDILRANPAGFIPSVSYSAQTSLNGFGRVDETIRSNSRSESAVIYHIQDAHAVFDAQKNLSNLVELLIRKEKIDLVLVEGGSGNVSLTPLRKVAWKKVRKRVGEDFFRQGKITGEEFLQLSTDYPFELYGIEDQKLYRQNLDVFLEGTSKREALSAPLGQLESFVSSLEPSIYPASFRGLESQRLKWQAGTGDLVSYLASLKTFTLAKKIETSDLSEWRKFLGGKTNLGFNGRKFLRDLRVLESRTRESLLDRRAQKLWRLEEHVRLLARLFGFSLTSDDYQKLAQLDMAELLSDAEFFGKDLSRVRKSVEALKTSLPLYLKFYDLAQKRDDAFLKNIKAILKERKPKKVILITGGFHSDHLGRLLKEQGLSRVLISPEISQVERGADLSYAKLLREKSKSTLRAPATFGSPFYPDLRATLEREQARELRGHIKTLIGLLDIDHHLLLSKNKATASPRSEVRAELLGGIATISDLSNHGTAILWIGLGIASVFGAGALALFLYRRVKARTRIPNNLAANPARAVLNPALVRPAAPVAAPRRAPVEPLPAGVDSNDLFRVIASESRKFFESSYPVARHSSDDDTDNDGGHAEVAPPPFELPMPVPLNAIPGDLDTKGKVLFVLREILRAMETMDETMRGHQKEAAERAMRRLLTNGAPQTAENFRQYLQEDIHQFFGRIFQEMQKTVAPSQSSRALPVSEEIEKEFARLPRYVKSLLSAEPALTKDPEVMDLIARISAKLGARPPVAEDLESYLGRSFARLMENRNQGIEPAIAQRPKPPVAAVTAPKLPTPAPKAASKPVIDAAKVQGQLRDLQRMRERMESDLKGFDEELAKVEKEYKELQESMEEARKNDDPVVQEALRPSIEAYDDRLQQLRHNQHELKSRLHSVKGEEAKLDALLDESGARSELREAILSGVLPVYMSGLFTIFSIYLVRALKSIPRIKKLESESGGRWPFTWKRLFHETVPLRKDEKIDLFEGTEPPAQSLAGFGTFLGWVIGGWTLYQAYHGWGWETTKILWGSGDNACSLGKVLWGLEIIAAPILGALLTPLFVFLLTVVFHRIRVLARILEFPFDYERTLRLHLSDSVNSSVLSKTAGFLSRLEKSTLETILQIWVQRGEHEKIKAFSEKGIWRGENQKFIALYRDIAGFEQAKAALLELAPATEKETLAGEISRWKTALDSKNVNGAGILKDLLPELVKSEKTAANVSSWMSRLINDPRIPWTGGFAKIKACYDALKQLDTLKADAQRKYSFSATATGLLDEVLKKWSERIPQTENKIPKAALLTGAVLAKIISVSSSEAWFTHILSKFLETDAALFRPSRQRDLLQRLDWLVNYEFAKSSVWSAPMEAEKRALFDELATLENSLKGNGLDFQVALPEVYAKIKDQPASQKLAFLRAFRALNPAIYRKEAQLASTAFKLTADKEMLLAKLASNNGSAPSIQEIEGKVVISSVADIQTLIGFYGTLNERADVKAQGVLLGLTARAPPAVFPVFLKSRDHLLRFYQAHPSGRDFENLPVLADDYRKRYGELYVLNEPLLEVLTDPSKPARARVEEARKTIAGQTLVRIGFPVNVIDAWDSVAFEEIVQETGYESLRVAEQKKEDESDRRSVFSPEEARSEGESFLSRRVKHPVVSKALEKMGRFGLYSYWEEKKPPYYLQFLEETRGLDPEFFKPGEKVRASYDGDAVPVKRAGALAPVINPVQAMKDLVRQFRELHPNIYDNFIGPKREILNGKPLEDFIDPKTLMSVAGQFRKKVADWPIPDDEKTALTLQVYQIAFSGDLQPVLGRAGEEEEIAYWQEVLAVFQKKSGMNRESELYRKVSAQIRKQIDELASEIGAGREGVVQFILTRGSVSDFARGEISEDCTAESWNLHFPDTVGLPTDPAFLSFRLVENRKWIGNIYALVLRDSDGKYGFYLDNMPVMLRHPVTTTQAKTDKLVRNFFQKLKNTLEEAGFDYLGIAPDPSSRENIRTALRALGGKEETKIMTKPGGFGNQSEFGISSEYLQGIGTALSSSISAKGTWMTLDNRSARERKRKSELTELERRLRGMDEERKRLSALRVQKTDRVNHLRETIRLASQSSRNTTARALSEAAEKESLAAEKISNESRLLEEQTQSLRTRLNGLLHETAPRSELREVLALAQLYFDAGDGIAILFLGMMVFVLFVIVVGALLGGGQDDHWGNQNHDRGGYDPRGYGPRPSHPFERHFDDLRYNPTPMHEIPEWSRHPLIVELTELFRFVLKNVTKELQRLVPSDLFFPIMGFGANLSAQTLGLLTAAKVVLKELKEKGSLMPFLKEQDYYKKFKAETGALGLSDAFDQPGFVANFDLEKHDGTKVPFALELSERTADDLLRGDVSRDCTGLGACAAFYETIPQFLLDPGFLDLKLRMRGKWVGNVYVIVMKREGKPVLVIDAVQLPTSFVNWPISPEKIALKTVGEVAAWAGKAGFKEVFMSEFVSNFFYLQKYFDARFPSDPRFIEKIGGFEHLKTLNLWNDTNHRNQYIETFSARWNEPLRVDPNSAAQELLIRPVWPEAGKRSEMRNNHVWKLEGLTFEVPDSDLSDLHDGSLNHEKANQDILRQVLQNKEIGVAEAFRAALPDPKTKIWIRVHDETETKRVYKFIIIRPDGRRNFMVYVNKDEVSFRPYTEDLNLVDTALVMAREKKTWVDFLDIFRRFGEPPDPKLHEIPPFGIIYVATIKTPAGFDPSVKIFDLRIDGNKEPSIRILIKPKKGDALENFPNSKAVYDFEWQKLPHSFAVYSPQKVFEEAPAGVKEDAKPESGKEKASPAVRKIVRAKKNGMKTAEKGITKATSTAGMAGAGAAFIKALIAQKQKALFDASSKKIERIGRAILQTAGKASAKVRGVSDPSRLARVEKELKVYAGRIDKFFSEITSEIAKYKQGTKERKALEAAGRRIHAELTRLEKTASVKKQRKPARVTRKSAVKPVEKLPVKPVAFGPKAVETKAPDESLRSAELEKEASSLQREAKELELKKTALLAELEALKTAQAELQSRKAELSGLEKRLLSAKSEFERISGLKDAGARDLASVEEALVRGRETAAELETKVSDLKEQESRKEKLLSEVAEVSKELETKTRALDEASAKLSGLESEHARKTGVSETLGSEIARENEELSGIKAETARLLTELERLKGDMTSLSGLIETKQKELAAIEANKTRLLGETQSLEERERQHEETLRALDAERTARAQAEGSLETSQKKKDNALQGLKKVGERLKTTVTQLSEQESRLDALKRELEAEKERARQAEEASKQTASERDQAVSDLTHARQEREALEESLRERKASGAAAPATDAVLDGRETLEALLSGLPDDLWQLLSRHYPGHRQGRFQLTVPAVADALTQAWDHSLFFRRIIKNLALYRSHFTWFQKQPFYHDFKKETEALGLTPNFDKPREQVQFSIPGDSRAYSIELSQRDAEYLLRGFMSGDCTNCGPGYVTGSFLTATASHITDPGFLNFKVLRDGEWVGNVYAVVIREKHKPVLVIDAMQLPWRSASPLFVPFSLSQSEFPIVTEEDAISLSKAVMTALSRYSEEAGFSELWLSSFVSNFSALKDYFFGRHQNEFDRRVTAQAKVGGWKALRALGYEGTPYVESIGNPDAKLVWASPAPARKPVKKTKEEPAPAKPEKEPAPEPPKKEPAPEKPSVEAPSIREITQAIKEDVEFSYANKLQRGMEFIVKVPGAPVRWIAFDEKDGVWKAYEKTPEKTENFVLFDKETGNTKETGTLDLSLAEMQHGKRKVSVLRFLMLPPLKEGELASYVENGGVLFEEKEGLKIVPFSKKGFVVSGVRGAFFVHPGGDPGLESKEDITLPLKDQHEVLRGRYPNSKFVLGWHTNPGGEPILHPDEEKELRDSGFDGYQLVASPKGISLVRYYKDGDVWKKRVIFTKKLEEDWASDLETALTAELDHDANFSASGYQLKPEDQALLDQALEEVSKSKPRNVKPEIQQIAFDLTVSYNLELEGLKTFIESSDFKLVVASPKGNKRERAPPAGLGVALNQPGRDVYASFQLEPKGEGGYAVTFYIGNGIYELAGDKERQEILSHELYQALKIASDQNPEKYPVDIDLEIKIDNEIRAAESWESKIPDGERQDLGLIGGLVNRTNPHVRARAFARLIGERDANGIGTTYTALLRNVWSLANKLTKPALPESPAETLMPPKEEAFAYTREPFGSVVGPESLQKLFEMSGYVHENKEENLTDFLEKKIGEGKRLLLLNTNAPTPWILKDVRKMVEGLAEDGNLTTLYLDLPPECQSMIEEFLRTGNSTPEMRKAIARRFPQFLPKEFERPDLYEKILRAVYEHNLEARPDKKIRVNAYYQGRMLPRLPGEEETPERPERMPFPEMPKQTPPWERSPEMDEMPEMPKMAFPPLPLTPGVRDAFEDALSETQRNAQAVVLFLKPLDEFFSEQDLDRSDVASILQIDKYTGFGPEKPENQLAMYMSEQASPNQKSFAMPILNEAPFYEEAINPGLPPGLPFNNFNAYPDLILSTAGDGDDTYEPVPDEMIPDVVAPQVPVPVGVRSEIRERQAAIKELGQIGEPAVEPLIEALDQPSVSLRLGVIKALGIIGDKRATASLKEARNDEALKTEAERALEKIETKVPEKPRNVSRGVSSMPKPSAIYSAFGSELSYPFIRALLRESPLVVDIDAETLIRKEKGKVELCGWGFIEAVRTLERKLPGELLERIRIRVINLNPALRSKEIEKAFAVTPELRGMISVTDVPVRHQAFKGLGAFLGKDALRIGAEKNGDFWKNQFDILVKRPGAGEVVDGRKLFLAALLHRALSRKLSKGLQISAAKLLRELGGSLDGAPSYFTAETRTALGVEFVAQMDRANKLLASMA